MEIADRAVFKNGGMGTVRNRKWITFCLLGITVILAVLGMIFACSKQEIQGKSVSAKEAEEASKLLYSSLSFETVRYQDYLTQYSIQSDLPSMVVRTDEQEKISL